MIIEAGWKEHLLLMLPTNAFCESQAALHPEPDTMQVNERRKLVIASYKAPHTGKEETSLNLNDWLQAWGRLFHLIQDSPKILKTSRYWIRKRHFKAIVRHADR